MHFCRRYGLWHKHHFLTENACFLRLDEWMTLQKTQLYCSGKVTTDQFWVPWYHRRSQGTNISILYNAPNYAPSIYDTTVERSRLKNMASRSFQTFFQESLNTVCSKNGNFQIQKRNTSNNRNHPCLLRHDPTTHKNFLDRLQHRVI